MGECPADAGEGEAVEDEGVFVDVNVVVEIDEAVMEGLAEDEPDGGGEKGADRERDPAGLRDRREIAGRAGGRGCHFAGRKSPSAMVKSRMGSERVLAVDQKE